MVRAQGMLRGRCSGKGKKGADGYNRGALTNEQMDGMILHCGGYDVRYYMRALARPARYRGNQK